MYGWRVDGTVISAGGQLVLTTALVGITWWYADRTARLVELTTRRDEIELAPVVGIHLCSTTVAEQPCLWLRLKNVSKQTAFDVHAEFIARPAQGSIEQLRDSRLIVPCLYPADEYWILPPIVRPGENLVSVASLYQDFSRIDVELSYSSHPGGARTSAPRTFVLGDEPPIAISAVPQTGLVMS